jgi:hypothetical protein
MIKRSWEHLESWIGSRTFRLIFWLSLAGFASAVWFGARLPWIRNDWTWYFRLFLVYPLLLAPLFYFAFIARSPYTGTSGYKTVMATIGSRRKRVTTTAWGVAGLLFVPGFLAHVSYVAPAWAAELLSHEPWRKTYQIVEIKARSGPVWSLCYECYLVEARPRGEAVLPLRPSVVEQAHLRPGGTICVKGRTSMFGTIVTDVTTTQSGCA